MPHLVQMHKKYSKKGMVLVAPECQGSDTESIKKILDEHKATFTVTKGVSGPSLSRGIPHMAVFDVTGKLVHHGHPSSPDTEKAIKKALKDATPPGDDSAKSDPFAKPKMLVEQREWTNTEGKKISAALMSLEGNTGKFKFPNGRKFDYDITKLSADDQALIKESAPPAEDEDE